MFIAIAAREARSRWSVGLGTLLAGAVALSCSGSTSASRGDGALAGSGGARAPDGAADAMPGTGGGPGGSGGAGTGGRTGSPDASTGGTAGTRTGGTPGNGGTSGAGTTGTGGFGRGGAGGAGRVDVAGAGGSSLDAGGVGGLDAGRQGGAGGTDAGSSDGRGGMPGSGGAAGQDGGGVDGKPPLLDGGGETGGADAPWAWPATLGRCEQATDQHLLAVVYEGPKAPEPYDWGSNPGGTLTWSATCANDLASARLLGAQALASLDREDATSPYFYEFADETSRTYDQIHRVTKCEFYDGAALGPTHRNLDGLGLVASYLWFTKNQTNASAKIVAGAPVALAATVDEFFLCSTLTVYGDWGMYDEIRYYERRHTLDVSGTVGIGTDELLRTLQGRYHPNP